MVSRFKFWKFPYDLDDGSAMDCIPEMITIPEMIPEIDIIDDVMM